MPVPKNIHDNLRFLIAEVDSQIDNLREYLGTPSSITIARRILDRSGYTYNLMERIHNSCLSRIAQCKAVDADATLLRSLEIIATGLDRITELRQGLHTTSMRPLGTP